MSKHTSKPMSAFDIHAVLVATGAALALPECYRNDLLVHDLAQLESQGTKDFIWVARTCGTHIFPLDCLKDFPGNRPTDLVACLGRHGDDRVVYHHFCDGQLKQLTYEAAMSLALDKLADFRSRKQDQFRAARSAA